MKRPKPINRIHINPARIFKFLLYASASLVLINIFLQLLYYKLHVKFPGFGTLRLLFNVDFEKNIPTLFSYLILLMATCLLAIISNVKRIKRDKYERHWWIMTGLFFFLATDEILESHEYIAIVLRKTFNLSGIFWYAWIIPFSIIIFLLVIYFYRFIFFYLPSEIRNMFIISGVIYISGSLGMEMIGGYYMSEVGNDNMTWIILTSIEEGMEMIGISYFIYSLLLYSQKYLGGVFISAGDKISLIKK